MTARNPLLVGPAFAAAALQKSEQLLRPLGRNKVVVKATHSFNATKAWVRHPGREFVEVCIQQH